jgi:NitT/TauT family transport system ATP-binding protein
MAEKLKVVGLSKTYIVDQGTPHAKEIPALEDVTLTVSSGEFVTIIGPSGCGKSTFLMIVAGLVPKTSGEIFLDGKPVKGPGLDRGVVFQEFALFPWMTVEENICFGLEMKGVPRRERHEIARRYIDLVGLRGFEHTYPFRLSGGMKQRVAVARALAYEPAVLLMDEPFGQLDAQTRGQLQKMLNDIWERTRTTVLFVTHNIREAIYLADRVVVFSERPGRVVEEIVVDLPRPRDPWSEKFFAYQRAVAEALGGERAGFF